MKKFFKIYIQKMLRIFRKKQPCNMIIVYYKGDVLALKFRTFREAVEAAIGNLRNEEAGGNGFVFYQGNKCIGVI